jgi:pimeloyl-ACP methyl ester carboxylesterase
MRKRSAILSFWFVSACGGHLRYADLPDAPTLPHTFFAQTRKSVKVEVWGRKQPVEISYIEAGQGEPLLLIHGLMTSAYSWRYVIPDLARHYRVLVPDLPGAGKSEAPTDLSMTPTSIAMLLAAFQHAVGADRAYVVGNSLGGYLAAWHALLYPDRVERLMIIHAPGFPELRLRLMKIALDLPGTGWIFSRLTSDGEQFVIDNVHYENRALYSKEEAREYGAIFKDPARTEVFLHVLRQSMDPGEMERLVAFLEAQRDIKRPWVPVRLLWARHDPLVSADYGPRYKNLIPSAELVWVDNTSHFIQVDQPQTAVEEILRFGGRP